ncbi:D-tyrosyl-tRNA(Tyr) deacylase [Hoyosella rhizosphaerae]|uniref:D-aminoacyl-tRNA deacylase n=1 Tax=Hoyosella rhizosphaerae TaxID=1755582 RepID=A0A916U6W0_9ACTN|nr:D-aminoacyl-tRNA deacylase [Hoyosella rhizosphaerae]MBN4926373.1 D-tyrosyl-tRNA(Tyr) deacylase [Hoyosella rhizosphaerae]GGC59902.1 D-aminoacyl-tRNA deacylase [Hoyosella rhizosphaerae]
MIAVVSRVLSARVHVGGVVKGEIAEPGLLVLLGVAHDDTHEAESAMARKIAELRLLREDSSVTDLNAPVLLVSQFTLLGNTKKGRRPSWSAAAQPAEAEMRYENVITALRERGITVETGIFGADMQVESINDGPFTVLVHT